MPDFQVRIAEQVMIDGKPFVRQETLFRAPVLASHQKLDTGHRITCTLNEAQYQAYWQALAPRYQAGEEYAWYVHVGYKCCLHCVGYLTEITLQRVSAYLMEVRIMLRDSGNWTIPTRPLPTVPPAT
jgi:hypothetical protein